MAVYFFLLWLLFIMMYEIIMGVFDHLKEGFWGYYDRITDRIKRYTDDSVIYGQDEMLVRTLTKQKQELEDIMGQYVFYRFCERISVYLTQVDTVITFCVSIATVVFIRDRVRGIPEFWTVPGLESVASWLAIPVLIVLVAYLVFVPLSQAGRPDEPAPPTVIM